jgi:hypothetical protein
VLGAGPQPRAAQATSIALKGCDRCVSAPNRAPRRRTASERLLC